MDIIGINFSLKEKNMNIVKEKVKVFSKHKIISSITNERFHLIIFPTEQCNFRCVYCYEDFEIGKMTDSLVTSVKNLIAHKIPELKRLDFSWFGGEPLLAKDLVLELAGFSQRLAKKNGCKITGDMTTNGLLLDIKTLTKLVSLQQKNFQISIDGDKEAHDKTRITRTGRGSFDKIWQRLVDAANTSLDFKITLRVHVTDINQKSVLDFCKRYDQTLSSDPRFMLFFKAIENLGGNANAIDNLIGKNSAKDFANSLTERYSSDCKVYNSGGKEICYASKPNSLAIRADGNINKCTVALNDDRNSIGKINPDGTLTINNQKYSSWIKGFTTLDSWQMGCPLSYMNHNANVGDINVKEVS